MEGRLVILQDLADGPIIAHQVAAIHLQHLLPPLPSLIRAHTQRNVNRGDHLYVCVWGVGCVCSVRVEGEVTHTPDTLHGMHDDSEG